MATRGFYANFINASHCTPAVTSLHAAMLEVYFVRTKQS